MLVHPSQNRGFVIECVDGTIRAELFPGTDPQALHALMRVLPVLNDQLSSVAAPGGPARLAMQPGACANAGQFAEASSPGDPERPVQEPVAARPELPHAPAGSSDPIDRPSTWHESAPAEPSAQSGSSSLPQPEAPAPAPAPAPSGTSNGIDWLSDAIDEWRRNGPINFSGQTWTNAYEPSFRICREILANTRRDRVLADGTIQASFLDKAAERFGVPTARAMCSPSLIGG